MYKDYLPVKDADFLAWANNFLDVANAHHGELGITPTDLDPVEAEKSTFDATIVDNTTKQAAAKAATNKKNTHKKTLASKVRIVVRKIQANPNVPSELKAQLGINTGENPPNPSEPITPFDLVAVPNASGVNKLQWDRAGNVFGTTFIIECQKEGSTVWDFVDVTTKTTYEHHNQVPGRRIFYRVKAKRGNFVSDPSNVAVVYAD